MQSMIRAELEAHAATVARMAAALEHDLASACQLATETLAAGKKILLCGNGGSAADAQHVAAEFTGRFRLERRGYPAIALTTDTSALTAIGNDYGFERIFARQVEALAAPGDLLIGYTTSGNSANVVAAAEQARQMQCATLGLTGGEGGTLASLCDICLCVPSDDTARVQEMHLLIGHTLCHVCEQSLQSLSDQPGGVKLYPRRAA